MGNSGISDRLNFGGSRITADGDCSHEIKRRLLLGRKAMTNLDSILKRREITLPTKVHLVKAMVFPVVTYWCWELDCKESWGWKNWCFWTMVLEKMLESPLDCKEIQPVHLKGNLSWVFIGETDAEAETPILWPSNAKNWLSGKDPDTGKDWRHEEKGTTEDEMVGWHHQLNGHEFEQTCGVGDGQGRAHQVSKSQTQLSDWIELKTKECRKENVGPFLFLENSRPLSPTWEPQIPLCTSETPDLLSSYLGIDSLITVTYRKKNVLQPATETFVPQRNATKSCRCSVLRCVLGVNVCVCVKPSCVWFFVMPWTLVCQAPLSVGFSRQE